MPYGRLECVEETLNDIKAQKYQYPLISPDGKEKAYIWMKGQLRVLPFGFYEHIFPREQLDVVLSTLIDKRTEGRYNLSKAKLSIIRKALHAKKIPEFKTDRKLIWTMDNVHMIVLGIREDTDIVDNALEGKYKGWSHEAI